MKKKTPPPWTGETTRRWIFEISCGSGGFDVGVAKEVKRFLVPGCQLLGVFKVFRKSACFFLCFLFLSLMSQKSNSKWRSILDFGDVSTQMDFQQNKGRSLGS